MQDKQRREDFVNREMRFADWQLRRIETDLAGEGENAKSWSEKHDLSLEDTRNHFLKMAAYSVLSTIDSLSPCQAQGQMTQDEEEQYFGLVRRFKATMLNLECLELAIPLAAKERLSAS